MSAGHSYPVAAVVAIEGETPSERLAIALLNLTGAIHRSMLRAEERLPGSDGVALIDAVCEEIMPAVEALEIDHDEGAMVAAALAIEIAEGLGLSGVFREPDDREDLDRADQVE